MRVRVMIKMGPDGRRPIVLEKLGSDSDKWISPESCPCVKIFRTVTVSIIFSTTKNRREDNKNLEGLQDSCSAMIFQAMTGLAILICIQYHIFMG